MKLLIFQIRVRQKLLVLISATYVMWNNIATCAIKSDWLHRPLVEPKRAMDKAVISQVSSQLYRLRMQKQSMIAPINNTYDVLEHIMQ